MAGSRSGATGLIAFLATLGAFFSFLRPLTGLVRKLRLAKGFLKLAQVSSFIAGAQQLCLIAFEPSRFRRHLRPHDAVARARAYIGVIVSQHQTDARWSHEDLNTGHEQSPRARASPTIWAASS